MKKPRKGLFAGYANPAPVISAEYATIDTEANSVAISFFIESPLLETYLG